MTTEIPANYEDPAPNPELMGWGDPTLTDDQKQVAERGLIESLPIVCAASSASGATKMIEGVEKSIRAKFKFDKGWDTMVAERMVYGLSDEQTLMIGQNMGNCVGNSHGCLLAGRIAHEVVALGDAEDPLGKGQLAVPFIPYTYGVGRMAGNMLGGGDGSYCGAQIKGSKEYGFLPCFTPGLDQYQGELPQCSSSVGRLFGRSRAEIMKWVEKGRQFDLEEAPVCRTVDEAIDLIENKQIALQICSGIMPGGRVDRSAGFPVYTGWASASHSTQITASFEIKGKRYFVDRNQWGYGAHLGAPEIGIPRGCLVFPADNLAYWLKRAECIGIGEIKGLPSNPGL